MKSVQALKQRKWWPFASAFVIGALSALSFAPANIWPLMFFSFAVLFGLLQRAETLKQALLVGWLFGLGQFVVGLNWIATAFTYQAAMPAWLGWIAVVLLSLYLAVYPMLATGVAWRVGAKSSSGACGGACRRVGDHGVAARGHVHRLRLEPGRGRARPHAAAEAWRSRRDLRSVGARRAAVGGNLARSAEALARRHLDRRCDGYLVAVALGRRPEIPPRHQADPRRPAEHRAAGQVASRLFGDRGAAARPALARARWRTAPPAVLAGGGRHQPDAGRAIESVRRICRIRAVTCVRDDRSRRICPHRRDRLALERRRAGDRRREQRLRPRARRAGAWRATTRPISSPTANICRCGPCCRRSDCRGSLPATSISSRDPARGPSTCRAGARSVSSSATRSYSRARSWIAATGPTSSSIRPTTPGSAPGDRRSIWRRRGCVRRRRGFR